MYRAALLAALCLSACDAEPTPVAAEEAADPVAPRAVRYTLSWQLGAASPAETGGFGVTNDLGHRIEVVRGYLTSYSAQLVPCAEESLARAVLRWAGLGTAWAGHPGDDDPSVTDGSVVESLTTLEARVWTELSYVVETERYCKAHYLAARAEHHSDALPADVSMVGQTLHLEGTVTRPGEAPAPFTLRTDLSTGRLQPLVAPDATDVTFELDPEAHGAEVFIERDVGMLFSGIDLVADTAEVQASQLVLNLADATQIRVVTYTAPR